MMVSRRPELSPGDPISAIETPALIVDLDALEANLLAMADFGKVQGVGSMTELSQMAVPSIRQFFDGTRARAAQTQPHSRGAAPKAAMNGSASSKPK